MSSAHFYGKTKSVIYTGSAPNVSSALTWPGEEVEHPLERPQASAGSSGSGAGAEAPEGVLVPSGWGIRRLVSGSSEQPLLRSEHGDQYRHFIPAVPPPPPLPVAEEPPPPPTPAPTPADTQPATAGRLQSGREHDCQTDLTSFPPALPAPKSSSRPKARAPKAVKPPFACYGRGNSTPLSSKDYMASFNLNPLLHPAGSKDTRPGTAAPPHKVFATALMRANYDPSAYNPRGLAARLGAGVSADLPPPPPGSAAAKAQLLAGSEVQAFPSASGLTRDVATQRTCFELEEAVSEALREGGCPSSTAALNLPLLTQRLPRLRALEGWQYSQVSKEVGVGAAASLSHGGTPLWKEHQASISRGAPLPFSPGRGVLNRAEYLGETQRSRQRSPAKVAASPSATATAAATPLHRATPSRAAPGTLRQGAAPPIVPTAGPRAGQVVVVTGKPGPVAATLAATGTAAAAAATAAATASATVTTTLSASATRQVFSAASPAGSTAGGGTPFRFKGDSRGVTKALDWESGVPQQQQQQQRSVSASRSREGPHFAESAGSGEVLVTVSGTVVPAFEVVPTPLPLDGLKPPPAFTPIPSTRTEAVAALEAKRAAAAALVLPGAGAAAAPVAVAVAAAAAAAAAASPVPKPVALSFHTKTWEELDTAGCTSEQIAARQPPPRHTKKEAEPSKASPTKEGQEKKKEAEAS